MTEPEPAGPPEPSTDAAPAPGDAPPDPQAEWDAWFAWRAFRRRQLRRATLKWTVVGTIWGALALVIVGLWFLRDLPRPEAALDAVRKPSLIVTDSTGTDIATYGDVVGDPLRLAEMPAFLPAAAVSIEDRRFYQHGALDPMGILRAAAVDIVRLRVAQGGSTITQQVAKTLFLSDARTWRRKLQELVLSHWLAQTFTKDEILEIWLNRVYFGQGAWGVDAAAHVYFGVSARHVTLWQAAMIAGLPRAPSRFNPRNDAQAAIARTHEVLTAMVQTHAITQIQADSALRQIHLASGGVRQGGWFTDWVATQAAPQIPDDTDAVLRTTLDGRLQNRAEQRLAAILSGPGARAAVSQGAAIVMDANTGAMRAMVGGKDYQSSPYNRAVEARRQPGSAFKPFVWLAALEHGTKPDDPVLDAPIRIDGYTPADFSHQYLGTITVEEALALSINTASVRLLLQSGGPAAASRVAARLGIADKLPQDASLALGTGDVGLLELARAYAAFCNGGRLVQPTGLATIVAGRREVALDRTAPRQVIDPDKDAQMQRMLRAVVTRGTGVAAGLPGHDVMGKTGTTQDFRDAWFVGCVDRRDVVGVWLGNDDGTPMHGIDGGSLPAELFRQIAGGL